MLETMEQAINQRNTQWEGNLLMPNWVNTRTVGLDQFFTRPEIAEHCQKSLIEWMEKDGANESHYKFIEPSAGRGAFYDLLPNERRVGIDVMLFNPDFVKRDFLSWQPKRMAIAMPP